MKKQPGDIFMIEANGYLAPGVECIVMEVNDEGEILKAKAAVPDERLGKHGFFMEGEDYVVFAWELFPN